MTGPEPAELARAAISLLFVRAHLFIPSTLPSVAEIQIFSLKAMSSAVLLSESALVTWIEKEKKF